MNTVWGEMRNGEKEGKEHEIDVLVSRFVN